MTIKSVQRRHVENRYSRAAIAADAVGITHFVLANLLFFLGEYTPLLEGIDVVHGGYVFITQYIDAPIFGMLRGYIGNSFADGIYLFLTGELVIVVASVVYALIVYAVLKILSFFSV